MPCATIERDTRGGAMRRVAHDSVVHAARAGAGVGDCGRAGGDAGGACAMSQSPLLRFASNAFLDLPDVDPETDPSIFGQTLATWLAQRLQAQGYVTGEAIAEDFGWCVPLARKPQRLWLACSGGAGDPAQWRVFVFAEGGLLRRLFGPDAAHALDAAFAAVKRALESATEVADLREEAVDRD